MKNLQAKNNIRYGQLLLVVALIFFISSNVYSLKQKKEIPISLRDKIAQMILVYHVPSIVIKHKVGGVLLMKNMIKPSMKIKQELKRINKKLRYPLLVCIDQEGGKINRLGNLKQFKKAPSARKMSNYTLEEIETEAKRISSYLIKNGINVNLAPCVDPAINHNGDSAFMWFERRSFGLNNKQIINNANAFIKGTSVNNVISVLKHFPGYNVLTNSDLQKSVSDISEKELLKSMEPFKELSKKADGLMMNNIFYKNIDSLPAVLSPKFVNMARDINQENLIISDDLWAYSLRAFVKPGASKRGRKYPDKKFAKIIELAFRAGNDMLMVTYPQKVPLMIATIEKIVKKEPKMMQSLNDSYNRIIKIKERYKKN